MWKCPLSAHGFGSFGRLCLHPGWAQDELSVPRRAELSEECKPSAFPVWVRAQLQNLLLSLWQGNAQKNPNVGLAEPWGPCWGQEGAVGVPAPCASVLPALQLCSQENFPLSAAGDVFVPWVIAALSCCLWTL